MTTLSDRLVEYLELLGVEYVFGVPGGQSSALYEALDRSARRGGPRAVFARHESGAASMADGYARETGRLGVCSSTTGPGATNMITGVAGAYYDHTPLLVLTAQTPVPKFGRAAMQESSPEVMDTTAMLGHCTRYSTVVTHPEQLEFKLCRALTTALRDDPGPAHLSLPLDLARQPALGDRPAYPDLPRRLARRPSTFDPGAVDALLDEVLAVLGRGGRVSVLVGHDARGATAALMDFAERAGAPVATTHRGRPRIDPFHPLACGVFGFAGHPSARAGLLGDEIELILAVGTGLGALSTSGWDPALLGARLVHVHPRPRYLSRAPMARLHVHGEPALVFERLSRGLERAGHRRRPRSAKPAAVLPPQIELRDPDAYRDRDGPIHPQQVLWAMMNGLVPPDARIVTDACNWVPWTLHYYFSPHHEAYRVSSELGAMGWGIGACVGTALGAPGTPVVSFVGDGGILMSGQSIAVAVQEQLPIVYIVLNDGAYGMVRHRHQQISKAPLPFTFPRTDFAALGRALGARGHRIETMADLRAIDADTLFGAPGPVVLDVVIDPDLGPRLGLS